jgi:CheY-like chemotaxis protein
VLLIHNGDSYQAHVKHLTDSGLSVSEAHADDALRTATALQPEIIILDFGCDGETTGALKAHPATAHIPVIALADLGPS